MKLQATFSQRWWNKVGIGKETDYNVGRFSSTSPVANIVAWYPGSQARDEDGNYSQIPAQCRKTSGQDMGSLMMYATISPGDLWGGLTRAGYQGTCNVTDANQCGQCFNEDSGFFVSSTNPASNHVPQILVDSWRSELSEMFGAGLAEIPEPTEVKYKIWDPSDSVTRSWATHQWGAGIEWWKIYDEVLEVGGRGSNLHIVGEAFSFNWGWGEGALETAEYLLHEHLHLPLPAWLTRRDYCYAMPFYPFERH